MVRDSKSNGQREFKHSLGKPSEFAKGSKISKTFGGIHVSRPTKLKGGQRVSSWCNQKRLQNLIRSYLRVGVRIKVLETMTAPSTLQFQQSILRSQKHEEPLKSIS